MSEVTYKKLVDVEQIDALNDAATVFINDNGATKQVSANKFGAVKTVNGIGPDENGDIAVGGAFEITFNTADDTTFTANKTFSELLTAAQNGQTIIAKLVTEGINSAAHYYLSGIVNDVLNGMAEFRTIPAVINTRIVQSVIVYMATGSITKQQFNVTIPTT